MVVRRFEDTGNDADSHREELALTKKSLPPSSKKYWDDRYVLFSRFDEGIQMTPELWYSVTPEDLALFLAKFINNCLPHADQVLDLFCGGGGNTIQFARFFSKVYALDYNETNLKCTLHNAAVYHVEKKVHAIKFDWGKINTSQKGTQLMEGLSGKIDVVFSSPPWGGPDYTSQKVYDLDKLQPQPLETLLKNCFQIAKHVVLFLPRNSNLDQLSDVTQNLGAPKCKILYVYHTGRLKGICAMWGENFFF